MTPEQLDELQRLRAEILRRDEERHTTFRAARELTNAFEAAVFQNTSLRAENESLKVELARLVLATGGAE